MGDILLCRRGTGFFRDPPGIRQRVRNPSVVTLDNIDISLGPLRRGALLAVVCMVHGNNESAGYVLKQYANNMIVSVTPTMGMYWEAWT